jgi:glycine cleavage system regulatory protein
MTTLEIKQIQKQADAAKALAAQLMAIQNPAYINVQQIADNLQAICNSKEAALLVGNTLSITALKEQLEGICKKHNTSLLSLSYDFSNDDSSSLKATVKRLFENEKESHKSWANKENFYSNDHSTLIEKVTTFLSSHIAEAEQKEKIITEITVELDSKTESDV